MTLNSSPLWQEKHRPQLKFSPKQNWLNDPNGMVYVEGEYHLFYQYYPNATVWGPMHWGHAVSKDLVHWEELEIALLPDENGWIFSGCAVVDEHNVSGLKTSDVPLLLAFFTYHNEPQVQAGKRDYQTQGLAYSNDLGRTWHKYQNNPVLKGEGETDFRDPKVIWHKPSQRWIMLLAAGKVIKFYESKNLLSWQFLSEFGENQGCQNGVWECPDLISMCAEDGSQKDCLIVSVGAGAPGGGSGTQYFLGQFEDGQFAASHSQTYWLDAGMDNYAGVTWHIPASENEKRHLFIGWMNNQEYAKLLPTAPWRGNMTTVRELKLKKLKDRYVVCSSPIEELKALRDLSESTRSASFTGHKQLICNAASQNTPVELELEISQALESPLEIFIANRYEEYVTLTLDPQEQQLSLNRNNTNAAPIHPLFSKEMTTAFEDWDKKISVRIIADSGGIEVFINEGQIAVTFLCFPQEPWDHFALSSTQKLTLDNCHTYSLASIHK